jgi:hypothetical protein
MSGWKEGTEIEFSVKGIVNSRGHVQIGCKVFTQSEVDEVAKDLKATEPTPTFKEGDVYIGNYGEPRRRDAMGYWYSAHGELVAYNDDEAKQNAANYGGFLIVEGKLVRGVDAKVVTTA